MSKGTESFGKAEHLCGVKTIDTLFEKGRFINLGLLRVVYFISEPQPHIPAARMLISIPKRHFKKAVTRNLLKRRVREAYRKNKTELLTAMEQKNMNIDFAILWATNRIATLDEITVIIKEMIQRLSSVRK